MEGKNQRHGRDGKVNLKKLVQSTFIHSAKNPLTNNRVTRPTWVTHGEWREYSQPII